MIMKEAKENGRASSQGTLKIEGASSQSTQRKLLLTTPEYTFLDSYEYISEEFFRVYLLASLDKISKKFSEFVNGLQVSISAEIFYLL